MQAQSAPNSQFATLPFQPMRAARRWCFSLWTLGSGSTRSIIPCRQCVSGTVLQWSR